MLSDSKQRNDVLSQAYQGLHAEFVKLKAARQMGPAAAAAAAAAAHQHQGHHHHQHCQPQPPQQHPAAATTFAAFADPSALGLPDTGLDLDVFGYTDMATYAHI